LALLKAKKAQQQEDISALEDTMQAFLQESELKEFIEDKYDFKHIKAIFQAWKQHMQGHWCNSHQITGMPQHSIIMTSFCIAELL
jgi:hypothetical protein